MFSRHKLALLRLWNRLVTLPDTRLTNNIFLWDLSFKDKAGSWSNVLNKLLSETEIEYNFENLLPYNLHQMYYILKSIERDAWIWVFLNTIDLYLHSSGPVFFPWWLKSI